MRLGAVAQRVASLSSEYHALSNTGKAWTRQLASASSSVRLNEDQWLTVLYVTCTGILVVTLCIIVVVRLFARLKSAEEEIERLSSSSARSWSPAPVHGLHRQHSLAAHHAAHHGPFTNVTERAHLHALHGRFSSANLEAHPRHSHKSRGGSDGATESSTDDGDGPNGMFELPGEQLVDDFGISGLCLVSKTTNVCTVMIIAGQAFFLQFIILIYIAKQLEPHPNLNKEKKLPVVIVDAAIYLHFLNCVQQIPSAIFAMRTFRSSFEDDEPWHTLIFGIIYLIDALVTPMAQLIIGALFLCTSATVADVIMNSCAVAYISGIDNMILAVKKQMDELADRSEDYPVVAFPVNKDIIDVVQMTFVVVPVYPMAFSCCMAYLGLKVFHL